MEPKNRLETGPTATRPIRRSSLGLKPVAAIAAFAFLLVIAMWAAVWSFLHNEYVGDIEAQKRHNENLTRALEQQTVRVLAAADQALLRVKQRIESRHHDIELDRIVSETGLAPQILMHFAVHNREGFITSTNMPLEHAKTPVNDSDREHFRVHVHRDSGQLFIGPTIMGRLSERLAIPLSRRLNAPDGSFDGIVTAFLDPAYFRESYGQVQLGREGFVVLAGLDGTVRARSAGGSEFGAAGPLNMRLPHLAEAASLSSFGSYIATDRVQRIYSFRRVADYPVVIAVGTSVAEALAHYDSNRRVYLSLATVFTAVVLIAAISLILSFERLLKMAGALRQSEAAANSANRMKSEFLASMSHELRTPLTSIRGFSELMERRLDHAGFREQAGIIRRAAEHLTMLLNDILDMSTIEAGAMEIVRKPTDIRKLAGEVIALFRTLAETKRIQLNLNIDVDVPRIAGWDALRVKQILNNLLSNALKFTGAGIVELHVARDAERIVMTVADTGPGIAAEMQDAIFERFRQGDAEVSRQHGGTGLGLALSRSFAQLMAGELTLDSELGRGSRFILTLPIGDVSQLEDARPLPLAA